jgi:hypothetical protein
VQTRKQELMMVIDDAVLDINAAVVYANYSKQEHSDSDANAEEMRD